VGEEVSLPHQDREEQQIEVPLRSLSHFSKEFELANELFIAQEHPSEVL